jgi:uncharacterized membrane protein
MVAFVLANVIPVLGGILASLFLPVLMGGWMLAARKSETGGHVEIADLFACLQGESLTPLLVVGAATAILHLLAHAIIALTGLGAVTGFIVGASMSSAAMMGTAMGLGFIVLLVALVIYAVISALLWFAVPRVVFDRQPPVEALKTSIAATLANLPAFLVFEAVGLVLSIVATVLFGLGWLVLLPVGMLAMYVSYRDVFGSAGA